METTGQRFKHLRQEFRLSQDDFGNKIGLSKSAVSAVEHDKSFISLDVMRTLIIDFNVNLNWLTAGVGEPFNQPPFDEAEDQFTARVRKIIKEELAKKRIY